VSVSADTQERWRRFYEKSEQEQKERLPPPDPVKQAQVRAFWQTCFMVCSSVFVCGLVTVFYRVLSSH
jgi:hypothetical protein